MSEQGTEFAGALAEAQRGGLAEADRASTSTASTRPHKLVILPRSPSAPRFGARHPHRGIRHIDAVDVAFARELGYVVKLLAIG